MAQFVFGEFTGQFKAKTDGAYWVDVEGTTPNGIWLVCPDNSLDFSELAQMDVAGAFEELALYCDSNDVPGWDVLANLITDASGDLAALLSSVTYVTYAGFGTSDVPAWQNPHGSISALFRWIKLGVQNAERDNNVSIQMADIQGAENPNRFMLPISGYTNTEPFELDTTLQI